MWNDWFVQSLTPVVWVLLSTLGMYLAIIVFARLSGVRSFAEMSTFDIAVTIAVGSLLATTVATKNPPLIQGLTAVATLYGVQLLVSSLRNRFRPFEAATDNQPIMLMGPGGEIRRENMRIARVTEDDLRAQLRKANVVDLKTVQAVVMEGTGTIHVVHGHAGEAAQAAWVLQGVRDYTTPAKRKAQAS